MELGGGPGEIEMDDDGCVVEVDAFAQEIGGEEQGDVIARRCGTRVMSEWGEPTQHVRTRELSTSDEAAPPGQCGNVVISAQEAVQGKDGILVLREGHNARAGVAVPNPSKQIGALRICVGSVSRAVAHTLESLEVGSHGVRERGRIHVSRREELGECQLDGVVSGEPTA